MDDRTRRLGEHAAISQPRWALRALGPVPQDPAARLDWEHRAGVVAAYRERYGYANLADAIGPEPGRASPEARAAWHAALAATGRLDGIDLRGCTDGELWLHRGTYERETAWAPPHAGTELRLIRIAEHDARVHAIRAEHEARTATSEQAAARHRHLARTWRALQAKAAAETAIFAAAQDTRAQWEAVTDTTRRIAVAADLELRRRHPGQQIDPLRPHPAEATTVTGPAHAAAEAGEQPATDTAEPPLPGRSPSPGQSGQSPGRSRDAETRLALGLTPGTVHSPVPGQVLRIRDNATIAQAKLDELTSTPVPGLGEHDPPAGPAWPIAAGRDRDAILQPPQPGIVPSARVLQHRHAAQAGIGHAEPERG
jgi:hypothetical protein